MHVLHMERFMYQLKKTEVTCICDNVYVLTDRAGCCVNLVVGKEKALVLTQAQERMIFMDWYAK